MIDETVEEIREMQTHSSSVVAVKAARALEELLDREFATVEEYVRALDRNASVLQRANPSHASLHNVVREVLDAVEDADVADVAEAKAVTRETIDRVVERVEQGKRRAAENAAEHVEDGATLLTHDYSSTVLEALELVNGRGDHIEVYATEARPRYLGRKAVRVLAEMGRVEPHLITDGACGYHVDAVDEVMIGMDCIVGDTLYNRVGTYPLAAVADHAGVPLTVVGSSAKLVEDGFVFENEFRSPSEVMREPAEGFAVENPAYDATPTDLVDRVITDDGVLEF